MVTTTNSANLRDQIIDLKKQRNAILLVHNYQVGEIQDMADYVGDSLGLAYKAKETDADTIVFCGVHFMAETAKIVNPTKTVILPDKDAGCSLEQSCSGDQLESFLRENDHKNYYVIAYINCSAHVKSLSDCICTSGNAIKIVESAPKDRPILFVPDQNLGSWVMEQTGRKMDLWQGSCYVHVEYTRESILKIREEYPNAELVSHPECAHVKSLSDCICTSGNAIKIVESAPKDRPILFVPDQNLGSWVMEQTGRKMDLWQGSCYVHVEYTRESILKIREEYPNAELVSHPECTYAVRMLSDEVCSTEKMIGYAKNSKSKDIIIATENGMLHRLRNEVPDKNFIPAPTQNCACSECHFMKMNTLEKLRDCLLNLSPEVVLPEEIRVKAATPIQRMLELSN